MNHVLDELGYRINYEILIQCYAEGMRKAPSVFALKFIQNAAPYIVMAYETGRDHEPLENTFPFLETFKTYEEKTAMNEIQIFDNSEFGQIRTVEVNGEPWFVGKDVAVALGYTNPRKAIMDHVDSEDKTDGVTIRDSIGREQKPVCINESGLYSLILSSKLPGARKFKRWVTSEVLPAIRKTGGYALPKDYPAALRALAAVEEQRLALAAENEAQRQVIADLQPIKQYVDSILSSNSAITTSQVAADYDLSANRLNKILHEEGIQRKVNGQWILYRKYMGKGYTKSVTIHITHSDGMPDTKLNTQWTQKGRLMIHEILQKRGIQAVIDRTT